MNTEILKVELTKDAIQSHAQNLLSRVVNGELNPLEIKLQLKALESLTKSLKDIDKLAREEAEKYGSKSFEYMGAKIDLAETGTSYDYSNCNDPELIQLQNELEEATNKIKERQKFLQSLKTKLTIVIEGTGEIAEVLPPIKSSTSSLKITFK